ncbi:MAG: AbrB family transcriptional regulator [Leptolyngbyaceae cyanobacterium MO_188.B28]|nr:AbrB family transcriptional regulator [Leptolyngbyaceae cyanobacterium MO_188.B28]
MNTLQPVPLTGKALLRKVKKLSRLSKREQAKRCGYYTVAKNGNLKINQTGFLEALLAAVDISLTLEASKGRKYREPSYRVRVNKNGQILIRSAYTTLMGLKPGDEFRIKIDGRQIQLLQISHENKVDSKEAKFAA